MAEYSSPASYRPISGKASDEFWERYEKKKKAKKKKYAYSKTKSSDS